MNKEQRQPRQLLPKKIVVDMPAGGVVDPGKIVAATVQHPDTAESRVDGTCRNGERHAEADAGKLGTLGINPLLLAAAMSKPATGPAVSR